MNRSLLNIAAATGLLLTACNLEVETDPNSWQFINNARITLEYQSLDAELAPTLLRYATTGTATVESVLDLFLSQPFSIRVYPDRASLETDWAARFGTPPQGFQCWMIANADAYGLVMLSPRAFAAHACGHNAQDTVETRAIIAHEVAHLIHRRVNPANRLGLDGTSWFYEGLAVYASGQLNTARRNQARTTLQTTPPSQLARIMDTEAGYSLAGSLVEFIAQQYGLPTMRELVYLVTQAEILAALGVGEAELLSAWRTNVLSR